MRHYSRARLAERLDNQVQGRWLTWLDANDRELQFLCSLLRLTGNMAVLIWVCYGFLAMLSGPVRLHALVAPGVITLLLLAVFSIGIPSAIAWHSGDAVVAGSRWLLAALHTAFWPIARVLAGVEFIVRRLLGKGEPSRQEQSERIEQEILDAVSEGKLHGAVDEKQEAMIESVFELTERTVSAIMTPRTDVVAIPVDAEYDAVREVMLQSGHTRLPVYDDTLDHVLGVLYVKDLMRLEPGAPFDLRALMRNVPYVPQAKPIAQLLRELQHGKVHMAIVLDEYGGTAGLVTIEDILEVLVGEIHDEYDQPPPPEIRRLDADTLEVNARVAVREINQQLDVTLPEDGDYETIGGFAFTKLGRIPLAGEEFAHESLHFRVLDAEPRKINRLRIRVLRPVGTV